MRGPKEGMVRNLPGYAGAILWVDLTRGTTRIEPLSSRLAEDFIGGYGIGVRLLLERTPPEIDPLGPENTLGFITGPLAGTRAPMTCRFMAVAKSPLTGGWGDSNSGGFFADTLKDAGFDGVFFTGRSPEPVYVVLDRGKVSLRGAGRLWGLDAAETEDVIAEELGSRSFRVICIGPGGERQSLISGIVTEKGRIAARSGLGAVMGSKRLKAVAVRGRKRVAVADTDGFLELCRTIRSRLKSQLSPMGKVLRTFGTNGAFAHAVAEQDAPIKNWSGTSDHDFLPESAERMSGTNLIRYQERRFGCGGCPVACGGIVSLRGERYQVVGGHKPEYETLAGFGSMCLVEDLEAVTYVNELCNRTGLDTMSVAPTVAFAMECFERGVLTESDLDGIALRWGDSRAMVRIVEKICRREGAGELLGDGVRKAAERIGRGSGAWAMHVGGQELPMHDPRRLPGYGTTYCVDATPGRHTQSGAHAYEGGDHWPAVAGLHLPTPRRYEMRGKGEIQRVYSNFQHALSCSSLCIFSVGVIDYPVLELVNAVTGWGLSLADFLQQGARIATARHLFNLREGLTPGNFVLPARVSGAPPLKRGPLQGVRLDMDQQTADYYQQMGWDPRTGEVDPVRLRELGLEQIGGRSG